jgi:hypothetical protein
MGDRRAGEGVGLTFNCLSDYCPPRLIAPESNTTIITCYQLDQVAIIHSDAYNCQYSGKTDNDCLNSSRRKEQFSMVTNCMGHIRWEIVITCSWTVWIVREVWIYETANPYYRLLICLCLKQLRAKICGIHNAIAFKCICISDVKFEDVLNRGMKGKNG